MWRPLGLPSLQLDFLPTDDTLKTDRGVLFTFAGPPAVSRVFNVAASLGNELRTWSLHHQGVERAVQRQRSVHAFDVGHG